MFFVFFLLLAIFNFQTQYESSKYDYIVVVSLKDKRMIWFDLKNVIKSWHEKNTKKNCPWKHSNNNSTLGKIKVTRNSVQESLWKYEIFLNKHECSWNCAGWSIAIVMILFDVHTQKYPSRALLKILQFFRSFHYHDSSP